VEHARNFGEHNAVILSRLLDYGPERIAALTQAGVLVAGER